jgi:hypothetical protein
MLGMYSITAFESPHRDDRPAVPLSVSQKNQTAHPRTIQSFRSIPAFQIQKAAQTAAVRPWEPSKSMILLRLEGAARVDQKVLPLTVPLPMNEWAFTPFWPARRLRRSISCMRLMIAER